MRPELFALLDAPMNRLGTHCVKWDHLENVYGRPDLIAMWVADMDFPTVPQVTEALVARAKHPIYGYTDATPENLYAEQAWLRRRHGLDVACEWIRFSPGVVDSLFFCVRALTEPGDAIVVQPPVYGPFYRAAERFGRPIVKNPLILDEGGWRMDFDDLEAKFAAGAKMMILCNPHNPVGRVWRREELEKLVALALRYDVILVSDEIHAEFALDGRKTVRILSIPGAERCSVMLTSATKAFNLAGLRQSSVIIASDRIREQVVAEIERAHATEPNLFGDIAQTTAYTHGDEWMDAVVEYVTGNRDWAMEFLRTELKEIRCVPPEGTYLMWLDLRGLGLSHEDALAMLTNEARVAVNDGLFFGEEGRGWVRMNLATQRTNVVRTLENIRSAIRSR